MSRYISERSKYSDFVNVNRGLTVQWTQCEIVLTFRQRAAHVGPGGSDAVLATASHAQDL